jgi:DNA topoisomerase-1
MTILVIVESPAKCQKIQEYLGPGYKVLSSMGHIRALKQDLDAVGIDRDWSPTYEPIPTKAKTIKQLKDAAATASNVVLATDDDREGEGIAYHICATLKLNPLTTQRIVFHSITKQAIQDAIKAVRTIDINKFQSQQTRAMLDMLIGYTLSPVLWAQLNANGLPLSAGRCQTPALKLVLDRDNEIEQHAAKRFWTLSALFVALNAPETEAQCGKIETEEKLIRYIRPSTQTNKATVKSVKNSVKTSNAPKPLITSTLQQEASKSYNLNPKATMAAAQKLYEAGHITYMRTDNAQLSQEGAASIRALIVKNYGPTFVGPDGQHIIQSETTEPTKAAKTTKATKTKAEKAEKAENAEKEIQVQAAHEAIRPTHPEIETVTDLGPHEAKIYHLIWSRAFQSQMAAATDDSRTLTFVLDSDSDQVPWTSEQTKQKFLGWKTISASDKTEQNATTAAALYDAWSKVIANTAATWVSIQAEESFTRPSPRYTEASLIHALEEKGIGRPSTFASLVTTIVERNYVEKSDCAGTSIDIRKLVIKKAGQWPPAEQTKKQTVGKESNKLQVTPLGKTVAEFLYAHYDDIFAYDYTAAMEQQLDLIATGNSSWKALLQKTWDSYKARYETHKVKNKDTSNTNSNNKRILGNNIAVILSKKGPLLLNEETKIFASLPPRTSYESVTLEQALQAYSLKEGTQIGTLNDKPIIKKMGPYGSYAQWTTIKVPIKSDDTEITIIAKLEAKQSPTLEEPKFERKVGDYTIKTGPYGLYFFKHTLKKATFVKLPTTVDKDSVTAADLANLCTANIANKKIRTKNQKPDKVQTNP